MNNSLRHELDHNSIDQRADCKRVVISHVHLSKILTPCALEPQVHENSSVAVILVTGIMEDSTDDWDEVDIVSPPKEDDMPHTLFHAATHNCNDTF